MDITCGKLDIKDIIACSLSLKKSEYRIFELLIKSRSNLTIQQLSEQLSLDRTTIQKILKTLTNKGLIQRFQQNLENGGYIFNYKIKDKNSVKNHIKDSLRQWSESAIKQIDNC
ncbi:TPA: HTH domain-containing protein [Candidatus Woesearchaeota archaeon]|nr:HTH domain-containing protein [Candidatus Woesearchaeota archaeon]HIH32528.1 HTH domain-containing protein [Candidatus Woesearchaeota archaeon]HIH55096.1 HTH domain-containing protein [Candidatus Woesearchaeota archaeon]HIJ01711.1 HTH domain-containing protein [Candidatus Woesearchaeota archaeon]HIJ13249.1 HTH domain-containing protein [Candidatus Woesearchaeota archaeon]